MRFIATVAGILLLWSFVYASQQPNAASISLEVKDETGAAIPDAELKIVPLPKGIDEHLATDKEGKLALNVPPGTYDLTITHTGFATVTKRIQIHTGADQAVGFVLRVQPCPPGPCLEVTSAAAPDTEPLVGKWKLNIDKSKNPPADEVITIASQGNAFVLDFDEKQDNGYNPHYEVVTDMKGTIVKPTYADGSKTEDRWLVTQQGPKKFEMELLTPTGGWKDEYEISNDGDTLTMHRVLTPGRITAGNVDENGVFHPVEWIFVFDRVK